MIKYISISFGNTGIKLGQKVSNKLNIPTRINIDHDKNVQNSFSEPLQNFFHLKDANVPEEMESAVQSILGPLKGIYDSHISKDTEILAFVNGSGLICSSVLSVLEVFKEHKIHLFYVIPDNLPMIKFAKIQTKITFNIFQEYARSGMFERVVLFSNKSMEKMIPKESISFMNYYDVINDAIVWLIESLLLVENNMLEVVFNYHDNLNIDDFRNIARIEAFGMHDYKNETEILSFPIFEIMEDYLYFVMNETDLNTPSSFFEYLEKYKASTSCEPIFTIYKSNNEKTWSLTKKRSKTIQPFSIL